MKVGVVDIGTNSMRLLITDGIFEELRLVRVTGLGTGLDRSGRLDDGAIADTLEALAEFGELMKSHEVGVRAAVATSASRDAENSQDFIGKAAMALGVVPRIISGTEEGRLAYKGATSQMGVDTDWLVSDIGGGSTEFVTNDSVVSVDIGSVRLTDRILHDRPPLGDQMKTASATVADLFQEIDVSGRLIGVAGTWTSLAAMCLRLDSYDHGRVDGFQVTATVLKDLVQGLSKLTIDETIEEFPALQPKRAPVILAGAVVALEFMDCVGAEMATVSERDSLDGLAAATLALA